MNAQVAHNALHFIVGEISIPAMKLQSIIGNFEAHIGHKSFSHGAPARGLWVRGIQPACGLIQKDARRFEFGFHIGELELRRLKICQRLAELLALFCVVQRFIKCELRAAQ